MAATPSLWQFACALYARDGVKAALLSLQDHDDLDIPFLLFLLWHGRYLAPLDSAEVAALWREARRWSGELVQPVRRSRRWLAAQAGTTRRDDELYRQLLDTELACEKRLLSMLESQGRGGEDTRGSAAAGTACAGHYLALLGFTSCDDREDFTAAADERLTTLFSQYRAISR